MHRRAKTWKKTTIMMCPGFYDEYSTVYLCITSHCIIISRFHHTATWYIKFSLWGWHHHYLLSFRFMFHDCKYANDLTCLLHKVLIVYMRSSLHRCDAVIRSLCSYLNVHFMSMLISWPSYMNSQVLCFVLVPQNALLIQDRK